MPVKKSDEIVKPHYDNPTARDEAFFLAGWRQCENHFQEHYRQQLLTELLNNSPQECHSYLKKLIVGYHLSYSDATALLFFDDGTGNYIVDYGE